MTSQSAANLIEEMACAGYRRADILSRFDGIERERAARVLLRVYVMGNDNSLFWAYSFKQFHGDVRRAIWDAEPCW